MNQELPFVLVDAEHAREKAQRLFEVVSASLAGMLPASTYIRHIGATAVLGCLTKGDLDIVVRVPAGDFEAVDALLAARFARNEGSLHTPSFSAFEDADCHPHLGIQLAAIDGPSDIFHVFVEALRASPTLVEGYNALKRRHDGGNMAVYRTAKDAFVERVLADHGSRQSASDGHK